MIFNPAFYGNAGPSASGTVTISQNSIGLDIASYASADVIVPMSGAIDWDYIDANQYRNNESITGVTSNAKFIFPCAFCMSSDYERWSMSYANFSECLYVGGSAFEFRTRLRSISFPQCEILDYRAFYSCRSLVSIDFPKVRYIGASAFGACNSLSYISFPSCQYVDSYAFNGCTRLTSIDLPNCSAIGVGAFQGCGIISNAFTVSLPMCKTIGNAAFSGCYTLSQIILPSCTDIAERAFMSCSGLTSAEFPVARNVRSSAFAGASNLSYVSMPQVGTIYEYAFANCGLRGTVEFPGLQYIWSSYAFANNSRMTKFSAPALTWMEGYEFIGCSSLTEAYLPSATGIGPSAFFSCTALSRITLSSSLTGYTYKDLGHIDAYAFANTGLYSFVNTGPAFRIGSYAFASCRNLSLVEFNIYGTSSISMSMTDAFINCSNLQSVTIRYLNVGATSSAWSSSCVGVGYAAFSGCTNLRNVTLIGMRYISMFAFTYCSSLTLRIDGILPEIIFSTFRSCSLQSIYIASSLYSQIVSSYWWWNSYSTIIMSY